MSITVSNWEQICKAPTNRSPTKMAFSFSRANRFGRAQNSKSQMFYNIGGSHSKRATSFGYGSKYDFTKDMPKSPPPNSYAIPTFTEKTNKSGFCFGEGREQMTITGPLASTKNNKNPGPGAYEPMKKQSKIGYSMRSKVQQPQPQAQKVPGPGSYKENNFFTSDGSVFISKHQSHKAVCFKSGGERFVKKQNDIPGPGCYDTSHTELSKTGKYSVSNLQNSKVRSFGHSVRTGFANRCQTPGPGNYRLPSQFGYYLSKTQYIHQRNQSNIKESS